MHLEVETVPYAFIVLHAVKYPSKAIYGLLLGEKKHDKIKVTGAVPISHDNSPLAPPLEIALTAVHSKHANIVGVYFANQSLGDKNLATPAIRLAEKTATAAGGSAPALIVQLVNMELKPDCSAQCMQGHILEGVAQSGVHWKECGVSTPRDTFNIVSLAVHKKLYRELADFENHLDAPELDFYNGAVGRALQEVPSF